MKVNLILFSLVFLSSYTANAESKQAPRQSVTKTQTVAQNSKGPASGKKIITTRTNASQSNTVKSKPIQLADASKNIPSSTLKPVKQQASQTKKPIVVAPKSQKKPPKLTTVKDVSYSKNPTFQSTIRPIIRSTVVSPVKGKIVDVKKMYGDHVKKDGLIISLTSNEAKKELMSSVVDFIQSKDSYHEALATLKKNIELQKKGVISKQELNGSQSSYISSLISMVRTRIEFKKLSNRLDFDWTKIDKLNLASKPLLQQKGGAEDIVEFLLNKQYIVKLNADSSGIFLPNITQDSDQDHIAFIEGATIKEDQVIGMIANPTALRLKIDVPEFEVVKINKGQPALMKIPVLNNKVMHGHVSDIRRFEYNQRSGQIPTIPVYIDVTCKENCERYYSISAEVSLVHKPEHTLQVPLSSVGKEADISGKPQHFVKIYTDGKIVKKIVTVGPTTSDTIVITSGLHKGDKIVQNYNNPES